MKFQYPFSLSMFVSIVTLLSQITFAQISDSSIDINPLPIGSGARALGQGGAFIAVADDATAASWNPGGMTQLERPEFSIVGSFLATQQEFDPGSSGLMLDNAAISRSDLNYASIACPFRLFGKNMVAALNYQQIYDFDMKLNFNQTGEVGGMSKSRETDFQSKGGIGALTPAIAMRITPKVSVGVSVNFFTDEFFSSNAWHRITRESDIFNGDTNNPTINTLETTFKNFQAINVTTGLLWNIWEKEDKRLVFGATYKTPYTADVDRIINYKTGNNRDQITFLPERKHFEIDFPMSFGAGLAFRNSDALSFSMDVTWSDWSEFVQKNENGDRTRPLGAAPANTEVDDTYAVRLGTEYLIFGQKVIIPVRGGLFYEPRPSLDDPTDVYGFSVGSGITFERFSIDCAYQFRRANNVNGGNFGFLEGSNYDLTEHLFLASVIVYF